MVQNFNREILMKHGYHFGDSSKFWQLFLLTKANVVLPQVSSQYFICQFFSMPISSLIKNYYTQCFYSKNYDLTGGM